MFLQRLGKCEWPQTSLHICGYVTVLVVCTEETGISNVEWTLELAGLALKQNSHGKDLGRVIEVVSTTESMKASG